MKGSRGQLLFRVYGVYADIERGGATARRSQAPYRPTWQGEKSG